MTSGGAGVPLGFASQGRKILGPEPGRGALAWVGP